MTGQLGFDEGGVLEALNKPVIWKKEKKFYYIGRGKGRRIDRIVESGTDISVTTIVAVLILWYGPEVLQWFKTEIVAGGAEGIADIIKGAANYAQEIVKGDDGAPKVNDPYSPGSVEFESAMRHSELKRIEFKYLLAVSPETLDSHLGGFQHCGKWRRANDAQRKLYKAKWGKTGQGWQPSCWGD